MSEKKTIITHELEKDKQVFLLQSISNRIAVLSRRLVAVEDRLRDIETDRDTYRKERDKKEETTLDIIKKEIQEAANMRELKTWGVIRDRAMYVGIALLIAWLVQVFIK